MERSARAISFTDAITNHIVIVALYFSAGFVDVRVVPVSSINSVARTGAVSVAFPAVIAAAAAAARPLMLLLLRLLLRCLLLCCRCRRCRCRWCFPFVVAMKMVRGNVDRAKINHRR